MHSFLQETKGIRVQIPVISIYGIPFLVLHEKKNTIRQLGYASHISQYARQSVAALGIKTGNPSSIEDTLTQWRWLLIRKSFVLSRRSGTQSIF